MRGNAGTLPRGPVCPGVAHMPCVLCPGTELGAGASPPPKGQPSDYLARGAKHVLHKKLSRWQDHHPLLLGACGVGEC